YAFAWEPTEYLAIRGFPIDRGSRTDPGSVRGLCLRPLLAHAAGRGHESRARRLSAATQCSRARCGFAVGAASPVGSASLACGSQAGTRGRQERGRRAAEERGQEAGDAGSSPTRAPGPRAAESVLGLCLVPVIRSSPLVLTLASSSAAGHAIFFGLESRGCRRLG